MSDTPSKPPFNRNKPDDRRRDDRRSDSRGGERSFDRKPDDRRRDDRRSDSRGGERSFDRKPDDRRRDDRRSDSRGGGRSDSRGGFGGPSFALTARKAAFHLLEAPLIESTPLLHVENKILRRIDSSKDKSLARMIAYTALRHNAQLDCMIDAYATDGVETPEVRVFLKVGLTQVLFMEVPDHAAVSETVNAIFGRAMPSKGLINAILRRATTEGKEFLEQHTDLINIPKYLWRTWVGAYGEKTARLMLATFTDIAPIDVAVKKDAEMWAEKLGGFVLPSGKGVRLQSVRRITEMPGFETGDWWVQDFAAQIPVSLFGDDLTGKTILDLCAAPGGKTAQLLARGAHVIAVDSNARRLDILRENMTRLGYGDEQLTIVQHDAIDYAHPEMVDGILLDAPCSATGTIRKNPDLPFLKNKRLIDSTAKLQREMLKNAQNMLKPDGVLVFATCSLQPEEGEAHMETIPSQLKSMPIRRREVKGLEQALTPKGTLRTLPHYFEEKGGMDGFFIARFKKI